MNNLKLYLDPPKQKIIKKAKDVNIRSKKPKGQPSNYQQFLKSKNALIGKKKLPGKFQKVNKTKKESFQYSRFEDISKGKETYNKLMDIANQIENSYLTEKDGHFEGRQTLRFITQIL